MKEENKKNAFQEVLELRKENEELIEKYDNIMRELCDAAWDEVILREKIGSLKSANDALQSSLESLKNEKGILSNRMMVDSDHQVDDQLIFIPIKKSEIQTLVIADQMEMDKGLSGFLSDDLAKVFNSLLTKDSESSDTKKDD